MCIEESGGLGKPLVVILDAWPQIPELAVILVTSHGLGLGIFPEM